MCAIIGASFAPGSTVNRRKLAAALLAEGESRGRDASGFAYVGPAGDEVYKNNVRGSQLNVARIPQDATAMILHTRAATHGSPTNMANNHPIESPTGNLRLVHNGVIYNHEEVRNYLGSFADGLPEVDSSVIPAIIEAYGLDGTEELGGYASAAWFDYDTGDTLHLARFKTSTVFFAQLVDGSLVFASTADILAKALRTAGLEWVGHYPSPFDSMTEGEYFQIIDGEIVSVGEVEWDTTYYNRGRDYSLATSGGASMWKTGTSTTKSTAVTPSSTTKKVGTTNVAKGSEDVKAETGRADLVIVNHTDENDDDDAQPMSLSQKERVSALFSEADDAWAEYAADQYGDYFDTHEDIPIFNEAAVFYTRSHDGDYATYTSSSTLMAALRWHAGLSGGEGVLVGPDEGLLRWVNHFADIGHLSFDGADELSWVANPENYVEYELLFDSPVADGLGRLRKLVGA